MQLAALVYRLAHRGQTGRLTVRLVGRRIGRPVVALHRGWVHAVDLEPAQAALGRLPPRAEDALALLLRCADTEPSFIADARPDDRGACPPFHPARVVRAHYESLGQADDGWRTRGAAARLSLSLKPHASALAPDERPLVAFLSSPRSVSEIDKARLCPPQRASRLLGFLDAVGAIDYLPLGDGASLYARLGLPEGAPLVEVKRSYRRLARELHPDRHPLATRDDRRELERRFAEISSAYREFDLGRRR